MSWNFVVRINQIWKENKSAKHQNERNEQIV